MTTHEMTLEAHNQFLKKAMQLTLKFFENSICERRMTILKGILLEGRTFNDIGEELELSADKVREIYEKSLIRLENEIEMTESLATQIQISNKSTVFIDSIYHNMMLDVQFTKPNTKVIDLPDNFDAKILDITIEFLKDNKDISVRLYNNLTYMKPRILTIYDLAITPAKILKKRRNFGKIQLNEVTNLLKQYKLALQG